MKAAVCRAFGEPLTIEDVTLAGPGPQDISVAIRACAICHSDITYADGGWGGTLPAVYGHEAAGVVTAIGAEVSGLAVGDHVVVTLIRCCGDCHYCRRSKFVSCEEVFDLDRTSPLTDANGVSLTHGMRSGAFAEAATVHASQAVKIPASVPFDVASLLACGVITGYGAVTRTATIQPGDSVAVIGCGGVGLNAVQGAVHAGAGKIIALDVSDDKLTAAKSFGATHGINPKSGNAGAQVKDLTEGRGVDAVYVTVGAKSALDSAFDLITKEGMVVVVGMPATGVYAQYDPGTLAAWSQKIIGSKMGSAVIAEDIPALIALYQSGRLKLDELVSGRYRLDQINEAIAGVKAGTALRNVIVFE
jgi:S-(hydroxymethyl)glutathione dehydrogenase/alcohol dehydrogenase